jgi:hypothetical protein
MLGAAAAAGPSRTYRVVPRLSASGRARPAEIAARQVRLASALWPTCANRPRAAAKSAQERQKP